MLHKWSVVTSFNVWKWGDRVIVYFSVLLLQYVNKMRVVLVVEPEGLSH